MLDMTLNEWNEIRKRKQNISVAILFQHLSNVTLSSPSKNKHLQNGPKDTKILPKVTTKTTPN